MRVIALGVALLLPVAAMAQMGGGMGQDGGGFPGGGPGGGGRRGGGEGFGAMRQAGGPPRMRLVSIKRERFDKAVAALFAEADANHDGKLTADEVRGVIAAKRDALLRARFDRIDANHDHALDLAEFLAWQHKMGDAALDENQPLTDDGSALPEAIAAPGADGKMEDRVVARLIGQLDALTVTRADTNYDGAASLDELMVYERARFDAADADHDGTLSGEELRGAGMGGRRGPGGPGAPRERED